MDAFVIVFSRVIGWCIETANALYGYIWIKCSQKLIFIFANLLALFFSLYSCVRFLLILSWSNQNLHMPVYVYSVFHKECLEIT